jgi:hypothetical protein
MTEQITTNEIPAQRTPEEIEALKANWLKDPCWDIEETEGFEAHSVELKAYRLEIVLEAEHKLTKMEKRQRVKTVRTRLYSFRDSSDAFLGDDEISLLIAEGWQIANISLVSSHEDRDYGSINIVDRYITLTRNTDRISEMQREIERLKNALTRIADNAKEEIDPYDDIPF